MFDVFVYPYNNLRQRTNIVLENTGKYTDLGNCLMYVKRIKTDEEMDAIRAEFLK